MAYQIAIQNVSDHEDIPDEVSFQRWVTAALTSHRDQAELCIRIVNRHESQQLNAQYRHKDKPTNVLSFPAQLPDEVQQQVPLIGDLVVCADVVAAEAKQQQKSLEAHWAHMIIHGVLHLIGYDHIKDDEAETMESLEIQLLNELGFPNPYQSEVL